MAKTKEEVARITLIDTFAELHNKIEKDVKLYDAMKKKIAALAAEDTSDDEVVLKGKKSQVFYSAPGKNLVCKVGVMTLLKMAGGDESVLSPAVTRCREVFNQTEMTKAFDEVRGSRRLKMVLAK